MIRILHSELTRGDSITASLAYKAYLTTVQGIKTFKNLGVNSRIVAYTGLKKGCMERLVEFNSP